MSNPEFGSDPWLDAKLRNVPLPVGFLARLGKVADSSGRFGTDKFSTDEQVDAAIADVSVPPGLMERLYRISDEPRYHVPWRQMAMAASLVFAIGISYMAAKRDWISSLASTVSPAKQSPSDPAVDPMVAEHPLEAAPLAARQKLDEANAVEPELNVAEIPLPDGVDESLVQTEIRPLAPLPLAPPRVQTVRPDSVFGTVDTDVAPELDIVTRPLARGIAPPRVLGYDLLFQLKHGDHPFVSPSAHKSLQSCQVPLATDSASYQLAWRYIREGQLPPAEDVRTEEILAAMDYGFAPPAAGALALRTAAGPAPLGQPGLKLLQFGVQAGSLQTVTRSPRHLLVAVDLSSSMRWSGRMDGVRRAIASLADQLGPQDRLTLIGCGDQAEIFFDVETRDDLSRVPAALSLLQPRLVANLGSGLAMACSAAKPQEGASELKQTLVILTDGAAELYDEASERLSTAAAGTAAAGVSVQVVDLSREKFSPRLIVDLAKASRGTVVRAPGADAIHWALLESLTGQSAIVARAASLKVTFKPEAVAGYRLLGHEAVTVTGPQAAALKVDLRAGETATALFEVWLKPGTSEEVAQAELTWQDAATQKPQSVKQRVSRLQFAKSFDESPMSLQAAALAAGTAEALRGSYYAAGADGVARVAELTTHLHARLLERPAMRDFVSLVEQLNAIGPRAFSTRKTAPSGGG